MRQGNQGSEIEIAGFGFVDYFVEGVSQRLPVQFVRYGPATWARLGQLPNAPSYIRVTTAMKAESMGDLSRVRQRYQDELKAVLSDAKSWTRCLCSGASSLTLFRVLHNVRMRGMLVAEALAAAEQLVERLDRSEVAAIQGIASYHVISAGLAGAEPSTPAGLDPTERPPLVRP
jgi:hypothetical protein